MKISPPFILVTTALSSFALFMALDRSPAEFKEPDAKGRAEAIGDTSKLGVDLKRVFTDDGSSGAIATPGPADWLSNHREPGQTFAEFMRSRHNRPDKLRNRIYLLPIGAFPEDAGPTLSQLKTYTKAFFQMETRIAPPIPLKELKAKSRTNAGKRQLLTTDILALLRKSLPRDAYCMLAITLTDLYPDPKWNYVFGQASLRDRVGVFSFARHDPAFFGENRPAGWREQMLARSCKVLAHETGHMFGVRHCIYFDCTMNGSNNLRESDQQSIHLCPSCLRKMHSSIRFDPLKRYGALAEFYAKHDLDDEAEWVNSRMKTIRGEE